MIYTRRYSVAGTRSLYIESNTSRELKCYRTHTSCYTRSNKLLENRHDSDGEIGEISCVQWGPLEFTRGNGTSQYYNVLLFDGILDTYICVLERFLKVFSILYLDISFTRCILRIYITFCIYKYE